VRIGPAGIAAVRSEERGLVGDMARQPDAPLSSAMRSARKTTELMIDIGNHAVPAADRSAHGPPDGKPSSVDIDTDAGNDYDLLPYPSMPITYTQPAHLAALATLFGLAAPAVDRARVLEFGCASGGNIIPLAARFPHASFSGIDLSPGISATAASGLPHWPSRTSGSSRAT
jgi:hypothetical protein